MPRLYSISNDRSLHAVADGYFTELAFMQLLLFAVPISAIFIGPNDPAASPGSRSQYALLVGVNEYPQLRNKLGAKRYEQDVQLHGPSNDVRAFATILKGRFHFDSSHIRTLTNGPGAPIGWAPTRENIVREIENIISRLQAGDEVFLLFAGHGSQQPARTNAPNGERDECDETFLPADTVGAWGTAEIKTNAIVDDEFYEWLRRMSEDKHAYVWVVFDTCHSGTMTRGEELAIVRSRQLSPSLLGVTCKAGATAGLNVRKIAFDAPPFQRVVAFFAAQSDETTPEGTFGLKRPTLCETHPDDCRGLFSYHLGAVLTTAAGSGLTFHEVFERVLARYRWDRRTSPTPAPEGNLGRRVFGLDEWPERARMTVCREQEKLILSAGTLQGLTEGAILAAYPPVDSDKPAEQLLGYLRIASSFTNSAEVVPFEYKGRVAPRVSDIAEFGRCEIVYVDYGDLALTVAASWQSVEGRPRNEPIPPAVATALKTLGPPFVKIVDDARSADWLVEVASDAKSVSIVPLRSASLESVGTPLSMRQQLGPLVLSDVEVLGVQLFESFKAIFGWQNLLRIASNPLGYESSAGNYSVSSRLLRCHDQECNETSPIAVDEKLEAGSRVALQVTNTGKLPFDITVLFLNTRFGIKCFYPRKGSFGNNRLRPNETSATRIDISADSIGIEHLIVIAVPSNALQMPTDLCMLEQSSLVETRTRGDENAILQTPLGKLLSTVVFGTESDGITQTRGAAVRDEQPSAIFRVISWETVLRK